MRLCRTKRKSSTVDKPTIIQRYLSEPVVFQPAFLLREKKSAGLLKSWGYSGIKVDRLILDKPDF